MRATTTGQPVTVPIVDSVVRLSSRLIELMGRRRRVNPGVTPAPGTPAQEEARAAPEDIR